MPTNTFHHRVLVVGAGTAGLTVAARLRRAGGDDIAVLDPSPTHTTSRCGPWWEAGRLTSAPPPGPRPR